MCCFKIFRLASEYIRHAGKHKDASYTKLTFIRRTCDELRESVDRKLDLSLAKNERVSEDYKSSSKKRESEKAGIGSRTSGTQRVKMNVVDVATADQPHLQNVNGIVLPQPPRLG